MPKELKLTVKKKSKTSVVIKYDVNLPFLERHGIEVKRNKVILFKRVSHDFKTQENTHNETLWIPGTTLKHGNYNPITEECGAGKFHACNAPVYCDQFRSNIRDRYIAIEVNLKKELNGHPNLYEWKNASYPNKIAFGECKVLYECDRKGNEKKVNYNSRITANKIEFLNENQVFVFGSNADGNHAGGAAKLAKEKFGAKMGVTRGTTGQCYAIDTMSGISLIKEQVEPFINVAKVCKNKVFLVTEIGCGIAGFKPEDIAPLFRDAIYVENIHLPKTFWTILTTK